MDYRTNAKMLFGDQKDFKSNISSLLPWIQTDTDINLWDILTITRHNDRDPNIDSGTYPQHDILRAKASLYYNNRIGLYCAYECSGSYDALKALGHLYSSEQLMN